MQVHVAATLRLCLSVDGPRPTFEDAFREEYPGVVRVVAPIVGSVADAEGIAQDAFTKAYVRWARLSRYDRPGAWVRRVAIRDAVRFAERSRRSPEPPAPDRDPVDAVVARIDLDRLLARLPARQRACVVLHHGPPTGRGPTPRGASSASTCSPSARGPSTAAGRTRPS